MLFHALVMVMKVGGRELLESFSQIVRRPAAAAPLGTSGAATGSRARNRPPCSPNRCAFVL
jgi:hypothetical protein